MSDAYDYYGVRHIGTGLDLDIYRRDLGHPDVPDLFDRIDADRPHGVSEHGKLKCLYCLHKRGAVEWMYLRKDPRHRGVRAAFVHINTTIKEHCPPPPGESDKHKAIVAREVTVLERAGLSVIAEKWTSSRRARSDFRATGGAVDLAGEVQVTPLSAPYVAKRTKIAFEDQLTPVWITDIPNPAWIKKGPRAVIGPTTAQRIAVGTELLVVGGVRTVEYERCGRRGEPCHVTGKRVGCGRIHAYLQAARGVQLDDLIRGAAIGTWQLLTETTKRGAQTYFWLPAVDLGRYRDDRGVLGAKTVPSTEVEPDRPDRIGRNCDRRTIPDTLDDAVIKSSPASHLIPPPRPRVVRGVCDWGVPPCGAAARPYANGWKCDTHRPHTIRCGNCKGQHTNVIEVRRCHYCGALVGPA